ncbi:MAG: ATP-grasp domain-containing protein, partial [Kofleriaceae bacterium]
MTTFGPGSTIGVLGGGQLGRMMAVAARQMGYRLIVLDPSPRCPTAQVSDGVVVGALDDLEAANQLARQVDVITLDTEHVPSEILTELAKICPVRPGASVLGIIQDRQVQKQFLDRIGVKQAAWSPVEPAAEPMAAVLARAVASVGLPAIVKVRRAGYDGKGQFRIDREAEIQGVATRLRGEPVVVERVVQFAREISVVLARSLDGAIELYPLAENVHRRHILHTTRAPAPMPADRRSHAEQLAISV